VRAFSEQSRGALVPWLRSSERRVSRARPTRRGTRGEMHLTNSIHTNLQSVNAPIRRQRKLTPHVDGSRSWIRQYKNDSSYTTRRQIWCVRRSANVYCWH
jgi:hypothetical protein